MLNTQGFPLFFSPSMCQFGFNDCTTRSWRILSCIKHVFVLNTAACDTLGFLQAPRQFNNLMPCRQTKPLLLFHCIYKVGLFYLATLTSLHHDGGILGGMDSTNWPTSCLRTSVQWQEENMNIYIIESKTKYLAILERTPFS